MFRRSRLVLKSCIVSCCHSTYILDWFCIQARTRLVSCHSTDFISIRRIQRQQRGLQRLSGIFTTICFLQTLLIRVYVQLLMRSIVLLAVVVCFLLFRLTILSHSFILDYWQNNLRYLFHPKLLTGGMMIIWLMLKRISQTFHR